MKLKFRTHYFFFLLALLSLVLMPIFNEKRLNITVHSTYFVLSYFYYFLTIFLFSTIIGLIYHRLHKIGKPISKVVTIIHFLLTVMGLIFSIYLFGLVFISIIAKSIPDFSALVFDKTIFVSIIVGSTLLLIGFFVFCYGIMSAVLTKSNFNKGL